MLEPRSDGRKQSGAAITVSPTGSIFAVSDMDGLHTFVVGLEGCAVTIKEDKTKISTGLPGPSILHSVFIRDNLLACSHSSGQVVLLLLGSSVTKRSTWQYFVPGLPSSAGNFLVSSAL